MRSLARVAMTHPFAVLGALLALTLLLGSGLTRLELRIAGELLEPRTHPVIEARDRDAERFVDRREVLLTVRGAAWPLDTPRGLRSLRALDAALRALPELDPDRIRSVAAMPRFSAAVAGLDLGRSLDRVPDGPGFASWLRDLRRRAAIAGPLLSPDGQRALIIAAVAEGIHAERALRAVRSLRDAEAEALGLEVHIGGPLAAETALGRAVLRDLATLIPVMLVVIALALWIAMRSPAGVVVPLAEIAVVLVWTFGAMGWAGSPVALVTTILPVVLMSMGIADEIHLLERVEAQPHSRPAAERIDAALAEVSRPIVLTSLTTALAFLSFCTASIAPLRSFGLFAAFGIIAAMLLTFTAVPALLVCMPGGLRRIGGVRALPHGSGWFTRVVSARPGGAAALGLVAAGGLACGIVSLDVQDSWVENFSPRDEIVAAEKALNESFWGSYRLDLVFEGPPGLFHSPDGLRLLEEASRRAVRMTGVGGVQSPVDLLAELGRAVGTRGSPTALSAGELFDLSLLSEAVPGGVGLEQLLTPDGRSARLRLFVRRADHGRARALERELEGWLPGLARRAGAEVRVGGELAAAAATVDAIVANQLRSVGWTVASICALLVLSARSSRGLIAAVPPCVATLALLGAMGWAGLDLGIATSLFASVAVGVGVDYGLHLQHRFDMETRGGVAAPAERIEAALAVTGRALRWNTCVLVAGFAVLGLSSLRPNRELGLMLASAILACHAAALLLLPWLLAGRARRAALCTFVFVLVGIGASPRGAEAEASGCPAPESPEATARMAAIESAVRGTSRLLRMEIETSYRSGSRLAEAFERPPDPKVLWGALQHDGRQTWLLYVFSGPGRLTGTSLLIRDFVDPGREDETWLYLRAFGTFRQLTGAVERTLVPSTALSYEDARGYVSAARYRFSEAPPGPSGAPRILACPRTPELADRLGYGQLYAELDPQRLRLRGIDYRGLGGAPLKEWQLLESVEFEGVSLPRRASLRRLRDGLDNVLRYEYWTVREPLLDRLFSRDLERDGPFLDRMRRLAAASGQGERLEAELAASSALVDAYERRTAEER